jgi:hypothetical protein
MGESGLPRQTHKADQCPERAHIVVSPRGITKEELLTSTLTKPDIVAEGSGPKIRVVYKFYDDSPVGSMYLAVVVKELNEEGFIVTSYFTDRIRRRTIWKRRSS